jgi:hypothetical protein
MLTRLLKVRITGAGLTRRNWLARFGAMAKADRLGRHSRSMFYRAGDGGHLTYEKPMPIDCCCAR